MIPLANSVSRQKRPYVTYSLIGINSLVFLYTLLLGSDVNVFYYTFGVIPEEFTSGRAFEVLLTPEGRRDITTPFPTWGTLVSSMFIHGGLVHFGSNMLYLWVFGDNMEDRMGHFVYLGFYLMAGVAAAWAQIAVDTGSQVPTIGASGAIAGVLGAYLMVYPYSRIRTLVIFFFITVIQIPATLLLGLWILLQFWGRLGRHCWRQQRRGVLGAHRGIPCRSGLGSGGPPSLAPSHLAGTPATAASAGVLAWRVALVTGRVKAHIPSRRRGCPQKPPLRS